MTLNSKNIKLIVLDLDGILLSSYGNISKENLSTLKQCQEKGIILCLCSGRPTHFMTKFSEELNLSKYNGYIISYNGEVLTECNSNKNIYSSFLPSEIIKKIINKYRSLDVGFALINNSTCDFIMEKPKVINIIIEKFLKYAKIKTDDLTEQIPESPSGFSIFANKDKLDEISKLIKKIFQRMSK